SCGHAITNGNAESYAHGNGYAFGMRSNVTDTNADCNCDNHAHCHANANGNSDAYFDAQTHAYAALSAFPEASSDSGAETIEMFAVAKIANVPCRSVARRPVTGDRCFFGR